ncbi:endosomal/lysosomal potassium channel TMEM175 isoform X3 [Coregonus clupeaformis]|uniref:endosomal/lysosomal potassium channel TMEM175 isoform X3 n=1 Tax=Coregonus clupeaformis TaxID=59861 RepID=UPI001BDFF18E|nr:endosomal/lysosomal potassium channel TMEM175 isoform X3 [Coregonus clupeaformis]
MTKALEECGVASLPCMAHTPVATGRKIAGHFKHSQLAYSRLQAIQEQYFLHDRGPAGIKTSAWCVRSRLMNYLQQSVQTSGLSFDADKKQCLGEMFQTQLDKMETDTVTVSPRERNHDRRGHGQTELKLHCSTCMMKFWLRTERLNNETAQQQSYVILAIIIFLPYISQSLKWCRSKAIGQVEETPDSFLFYTYHPNEPLSKERVEAFSDGVFAIVATLLILDICEDNVPDPVVVQNQYGGSLVAALQEYGPEYLAYFGSFATVALLWFVHHSLFLHVTRTTRFMGLLNTFSLAFVGGLPLAYQLTHEFPRNSRNELEAIQISCVIIFFAGVFQLAIWVAALFSERETLHPYVRYGGREHTFMLAKLALYPCVALGTFFLTCFLSKFSASIFHMMEITVPFAFLLLRLLVRGGLALLRLVFCPDGPETRSALEEEEEEARMPFNAMIT